MPVLQQLTPAPPHPQPYDNGFYVGTQAAARINQFLEVDDFYKSTLKPFWNSEKVCQPAPLHLFLHETATR